MAEVKAVAWLVYGGEIFKDRAFVSEQNARTSAHDRGDGASVGPLYDESALARADAELTQLAEVMPPKPLDGDDYGFQMAPQHLRILHERFEALTAAPATPYAQLTDWLAKNTGDGKVLTAAWVNDQFASNNTSLPALAANQEASAAWLESFRGVLKQMNVAEA